MMARPLVLEDFDRTGGPPLAASSSPSPAPHGTDGPAAQRDVEEERLVAYEKGYGAGWEDATTALAQEQSRISAELARHLQELSFTYHEAHTALQQEVADVVRGLVTKVLAPAAHPALGEFLVARVKDIASQTRVPVEIVVAPSNAGRIEALMASAHGPPLRIVPEPSLGEGQAFLRFGSAEEKLDLDAVLSEMTTAVEHYFDGVIADAPQTDSEHRELGHG